MEAVTLRHVDKSYTTYGTEVVLAGQEQPDAGEVLLPEGWRSALRTFDLADVPYPRNPESPRLRDLKRAVTEECLRGSGR